MALEAGIGIGAAQLWPASPGVRGTGVSKKEQDDDVFAPTGFWYSRDTGLISELSEQYQKLVASGASKSTLAKAQAHITNLVEGSGELQKVYNSNKKKIFGKEDSYDPTSFEAWKNFSLPSYESISLDSSNGTPMIDGQPYWEHPNFSGVPDVISFANSQSFYDRFDELFPINEFNVQTQIQPDGTFRITEGSVDALKIAVQDEFHPQLGDGILLRGYNSLESPLEQDKLINDLVNRQINRIGISYTGSIPSDSNSNFSWGGSGLYSSDLFEVKSIVPTQEPLPANEMVLREAVITAGGKTMGQAEKFVYPIYTNDGKNINIRPTTIYEVKELSTGNVFYRIRGMDLNELWEERDVVEVTMGRGDEPGNTSQGNLGNFSIYFKDDDGTPLTPEQFFDGLELSGGHKRVDPTGGTDKKTPTKRKYDGKKFIETETGEEITGEELYIQFDDNTIDIFIKDGEIKFKK